MASTYTGLGYQLMATGENAGTWGTKTNTTAGGYIERNQRNFWLYFYRNDSG